MKKILSASVLFLAAAISAQKVDLNCVKGHQVCTTAPCTTIIFNNHSEKNVSVSGHLEAALSGAAKMYDGNFEFNREFDHGQTSCHVPTKRWSKMTKHINVRLETDRGYCTFYVPKSAVGKSNVYKANIEADGRCMITQ